MQLTVIWPEQVSALQPVPIEIELLPPPGVAAAATVTAIVLDPSWHVWALFHLWPQEGNRYAAEEPLQLPLEPMEGDWRLAVSVHSELRVEGERRVLFRPATIQFHDLAGALPAGADLRVPHDFIERLAQGDPQAGGRAWRYGDAELALWWAPGPVKPLLFNTAVVMLEATHDVEHPPQVLGVEEIEWQGRTAFLFPEDWPEDEYGTPGGPAEAMVAQGPDYHLYVLRTRALGTETIPPLLRQVGETLAFSEE
jgi:hypothetical protein